MFGWLKRRVSSPIETPAPHLIVLLDSSRPIGTLAPPLITPPPEQPNSTAAPKEAHPMKIFDTLKSFEHTFAAWVAKGYQVFRNDEPTVVALADRVFPYVKSAVQIGLTLEGQGALSVAAGALLDTVHAKADVAAGLLYDFGPSPTVVSAVNDLQQNLGQITSVLGIKSTAAQSAVAKAVGEVSALSAAVQGAIAVVQPAPAPAA